MKRLLLLLCLASPAWAGRDFDGTNDEIEFGSDTSIDNFSSRVICAWVRIDTTGTTVALVTKGAATAEIMLSSGTNLLRYASDWTTDGNWIGTTTITGSDPKFLCISYSNTATTNDPQLFVNCNSEALTTDTNPTGTWTADAASNLQIGETNADSADFDGNITALIYKSGGINAAQCNRHMWWGRGQGDLEVYHPFFTTKLSNEGTATANGTATGTTVVSVPAVKIVRPGAGMLNGGIDW